MDAATTALSGLGLFLLALLSEDSATLVGAGFAAFGNLPWAVAFLSCVAGIWIGDLGVFLLARQFGRPVLDRFWLKKKTSIREHLKRSEAWFARYGIWALVFSRFLPGSRLPTFLTAGLLRMPFAPFAAITAILAIVWVSLIFFLVEQLGSAAGMLGSSPLGIAIGMIVTIAWVVAFLTISQWQPTLSRLKNSPKVQRWVRWEFWPSWLFYLPIGVNYLRLAIQHGGLSVPTCANPGMFTGGLIGESKYATLFDLEGTSPDFTAQSFLIPENGDRAAQLATLLDRGQIALPFVLKPDVAQRGSGFKIMRNSGDVAAYLERVPVPIVAQRYLPGPHEVGIFYYRFPHETRGRIFAITEKIFPVVFGDGRRSLEDLIRDDSRAVMMAKIYLERFAAERSRVPEDGEAVTLVAAGNHAQGCIFQDGMHLWSESLENRIDEISRALPGFFIGRYDVRFASEKDLQLGRNFTILELNGAASEATSAYDARKSLCAAYGLLFQQWNLVFAIGAANRKAGHQPDSIHTLLIEMRRYRERSGCHPVAD